MNVNRCARGSSAHGAARIGGRVMISRKEDAGDFACFQDGSRVGLKWGLTMLRNGWR
jgi:hypothetical protein